MEDKEKEARAEATPEVLDKTFGQLLDQTAAMTNYPGLLVEEELEQLMTPFVQGLVEEVDKLYGVNHQLLKLATRCRAEALKEKQEKAQMKDRIQELQTEVTNNEQEIAVLREALKERGQQLDGLRSAYHREVVQVKEHMVEAIANKGPNLDAEDVSNALSRAFDPNLLTESLGRDAEGRSLDDMLSALTAEYDRTGKWGLDKSQVGLEATRRPGGGGGGAGGDKLNMSVVSTESGGGGGGASAREHMVLENDKVQLNLRLAVMRRTRG